MKKDIHPQYYPDAKITCACGNVFTIGSTQKEIRIEICSKCHPFYTGSQQLIDTAGRAERFKKRQAKASAVAIKKKKAKITTKKKKQISTK